MRKLTLLVLFAYQSLAGFGQLSPANITGNIESIFQYLNEDTIIGASQPAEKGLVNSYMNLFYTQGNVKAGIRVESYLPRINGYPTVFDGTGIGYRYIQYANDFVDVTLGTFYEQFGTGLTLRAYEDRALGYDNMLDGIRLKVTPGKGTTVKAVYGKQRYAFIEGRIQYSPGIVRGVDGEIHLNEAINTLKDSKMDITIGGSFVSKYQRNDNDALILPENVGCYGGRAKIRYGKWTIDSEYTIKGQDPSQDNNYIYNYGHAAVANLTYTQKGLGILFSAKSVDNMSYRSDRTKQLQNVLINYLPALNKTHTYNLVASLYPYATQPVGETAFQAEVLYTIPKGTKLGGKYGTSINANYSVANRPMQHTSDINPADSTGVTYRSGLFDMSDSLYWQDFNINITRKFNKNLYAIFSYYYIILNNDVATVTKEQGFIKSHIAVGEIGYKFANKSSIRTELQWLVVNRKDGNPVDKGDWATLLIEYTINSNWFASIMDQYNYVTFDNGVLEGAEGKYNRAHHPYFTLGYVKDATRIMASYGRQRAGMFCVGGVCRPVPASNGLTLMFTHSF